MKSNEMHPRKKSVQRVQAEVVIDLFAPTETPTGANDLNMPEREGPEQRSDTDERMARGGSSTSGASPSPSQQRRLLLTSAESSSHSSGWRSLRAQGGRWLKRLGMKRV